MKTLNSYLIDYHRPTGKVTCTTPPPNAATTATAQQETNNPHTQL